MCWLSSLKDVTSYLWAPFPTCNKEFAAMLRQEILLILDPLKDMNPSPISTSSRFWWIDKAAQPSFISFTLSASWLVAGCPINLVLLTDNALIVKTHSNCLPLQCRHLFVYYPEKIAHSNSPKPNYHVVWDFSSPGHVPCCVRWETGHYFRTCFKSCSLPEELSAFQANAAIKNAVGCMKPNTESGLRKSMALVSSGSLGKMCLLWNLNDVLPLGIVPAAFLSLT